jgi:hypothetical protein
MATTTMATVTAQWAVAQQDATMTTIDRVEYEFISLTKNMNSYH